MSRTGLAAGLVAVALGFAWGCGKSAPHRPGQDAGPGEPGTVSQDVASPEDSAPEVASGGEPAPDGSPIDVAEDTAAPERPTEDAAPSDRPAEDATPDRLPTDEPATDVSPPDDRAIPGGICPSLSGVAPGDIVLAVRAGDEIAYIQKDGTRVPVARFGSPINDGWLHRQGDFLFADGYSTTTGGDAGIQLEYQALLLDRSGTVRWRFTRQGPSSFYHGGPWLDDRGGATFILNGHPSGVRGVAIRPDGTAHDLPGQPLGPADKDGWVPISMEPGDALGKAWGFAKAGTTDRRPLSLPFASTVLPPIVKDGRIIYLGSDAGQPVAVVDGPGGAKRLSLGAVDLTDLASMPTESVVVFTWRGRPRWLVHARTEEIRDIGPPVENNPASSFVRDWYLEGDAGKPTSVLDLVTGVVRPLSPPLAQRSTILDGAGHWRVGSTAGQPLWRIDLATAETVQIDFSVAAPLRPFFSGCSDPPLPLADGRIQVALRNDEVAGVHLMELNRALGRRIGRSVANVNVIRGEQVGETFILTAENRVFPSCPVTWAPWSGTEDPPLIGRSLQIVPTGDALPTVFQIDIPRRDEFVFHTTGRCAILRGRVDDYVSGTRFDLGATNLAAVWW